MQDLESVETGRGKPVVPANQAMFRHAQRAVEVAAILAGRVDACDDHTAFIISGPSTDMDDFTVLVDADGAGRP